MRKYKVLCRELINGKWKCVFEYWTDCYCEKEEATVYIVMERMPLLKDIVNAHIF